MKILSVFNNKGGVGKTTLVYHLAFALKEMGKRVLLIDLDPQCNLSLFCMSDSELEEIWRVEDTYIDDYTTAIEIGGLSGCRTIHYLLKPSEEGTSGSVAETVTPFTVSTGLYLLPGRWTINQFEEKISSRWSDAYRGDPLAIRTITDIRQIAERYASAYQCDYVIIDTSPNLGALNKVIISTVDGFIVPALPDMFSLYGLRNIGSCLVRWKNEFDTLFRIISDAKRSKFPAKFVRFLGYTIYNAKRYDSTDSPYKLARAHQNYVDQIPSVIDTYISDDVRGNLTPDQVMAPIGGISVMHSHNTLPSMAQKYKCPMWEVPDARLDESDRTTVSGNKNTYYYPTKEAYIRFAEDFLERVLTLD